MFIEVVRSQVAGVTPVWWLFRTLCEAVLPASLSVAGRNGSESKTHGAIEPQRRFLVPLLGGTDSSHHAKLGRATKAGQLHQIAIEVEDDVAEEDGPGGRHHELLAGRRAPEGAHAP